MAHFLFPLICVSFILLGLYGGMAAISRFMRGYTDFWIFTPKGAIAYFAALIILAPLFIASMQAMESILKLFLFALMPFALFGHVIWLFGAVVHACYAIAAPSAGTIEATFDIGDGLMARHKYDEAAAQYARDLDADPMNFEALLRLARALDAGGRSDEAVEKLRAERQLIIENPTPPKKSPRRKLEAQERSERLLRVTLAMGDILVVKLDDNNGARQLYAESLELLFGYRDADALRARLKALDAPGRMRMSEAIESAQPEKIEL